MYKVLHYFDNSNITNEFSKSELVVYKYIYEHRYEIQGISSEKLAKDTFTSPATINRMSKKLGTDGYSHLKHSLMDDLQLKAKTKTAERTLDETTRLITKINFEESKQLAKAICKVDVLFIYSTGATRLAALYLERQLLNIGVKCIDVEQQKMLENFSESSLLILSSSGETTRTIDLANNLRDNHSVFALTAKGSTLDKIAKISFTHNVLIDKLDPLIREQQIHMLVMINDLVSKIQNERSSI